jgi:hypothetical protein
LAVYPVVNLGGPKSPKLPDVNPSNEPEPRESLKSLRMNLHDRCSLVRVQEGFEMKCTWYGGTAIVRSYTTGRLLWWKIVT